jgi:hypothetical protein
MLSVLCDAVSVLCDAVSVLCDGIQREGTNPCLHSVGPVGRPVSIVSVRALM